MTSPTSHDSTVLVLRRVFPAPRQRVFNAWIEPEALEHWLKPRGISIKVSKLEARVGGSFHFDLANGNTIFGTYLHIVPPDKLVFTWLGNALPGKETIVTLDFLDRGNETEVVLTHEHLDTPEMYALFSSGWLPMLDTLAEVLTSQPDSSSTIVEA